MNKRRGNERDPGAAGTPAGLSICALDADGVIRGANEAFSELFGVETAFLCGRPFGELVPAGLDLASDLPQEVLGRRSDGTSLALVVALADLAFGSGAPCRIATVRDFGEPAAAARARREQPLHGDPLERIAAGLGDQLYTFELRAGGRIQTVFAGPGGEALLGGYLPEGADLAVAWCRATHPDDREILAGHLSRLRHGESTEEAMRLIGLDGRTRWISFRAWPSRVGAAIVVHGVASDVTGKMHLERILKATIGASQREAQALEQARADAEHLARTDALTGVYNRRHLNEVLDTALADSASSTRPPALALLDVDHFKRINDTYGHAAGDAVLIAVARRIAGSVRTSDCVARWGGEEFCVLLERIPDEETLREIADGLRLRIEAEPVEIEGVDVTVTVSVGAAWAHADLAEADDLVDAADRALYAAKRRGRNQTRLYSEWRFEDFIAEDPEAIRLAEALALTASLREGTSSLHPQQVADLAMRTAERLGQPEPVVLRCRLGGWLHDVGKVVIPDHLLGKAGGLTDDEWEIMRSHPAIGEEIIRRVAGLKEATRAVRHHHEHWDGSGYPDGLAGDAIPIEARIVAAADAFSAMTATERPYRRGRERADALAELRRSAGHQLDPVIVDALLLVLADDATRLDARIARGEVDIERRGEAA